ncbi:uncharacterized protein [Macaca nemestrina]|uniref:uncharacterized protein isoform X2 n=1 Tax=Macaca nemestrina TaxID=9545 RepID=UPI0039B8E46A
MSGAMNYLLSPGAGVKAGRSWTASLTLRHCHLSSSCNEAENHRKHLYRGFREEPLPSAQNRQLCWSSVLHCQDAATQCGDRKGDSTYGARKVGLGSFCILEVRRVIITWKFFERLLPGHGARHLSNQHKNPGLKSIFLSVCFTVTINFW